jgi:tRNA nucleotidyltransferase (CCA-adding enzyme)
VRIAEAISARLRAPADCRDAARLAARWRRIVDGADDARPAKLLELLSAADALRRPERMDALLEVCTCIGLSARRSGTSYPQSDTVRAALAAVKNVDAGAIARRVSHRRPGEADDDAIARALRAARLAALRELLRKKRSAR